MPMPAWVPAYVGIGSNLDNPELQVSSALEALATLPDTRRISQSASLRNPAMGAQSGPEFVNAVAGLLTRLQPVALLEALLAIERRQGRDRSSGLRWAPRRIDLDLLVYGEVVMATEQLVLPHPGIATRNFVLFPLLEIAPALNVPGLGSVQRLAAALNQEEKQAWAIPVTSLLKAP